ncbi:MAG: OmpA family protein [Bacteroidales bacterium]|nr:OmpA family protein [Bacteroidales bacterium]
MKRICFLLFLLSFLNGITLAQNPLAEDTGRINLVFNGSFEEYRFCPKRVDAVGILINVEGWYQPTRGSADYFNTCGSKECGVPVNKLGEQLPHEGEGYCGIYCSKNDYREYLQTRLRRKLKAGDSIRVSFYVSLSEQSTGAVATLGALFTQESIYDTVRSILLHKEYEMLSEDISQVVAYSYDPQVVNPVGMSLVDTKGWQRVEGVFVAEGGEQYITLGNFFTAERSGYVEPDSLTQLLPGAYYYIDDVFVECLNCKPPVTDDLNVDSSFLTQEQPSFSIGSTFVLEDIYFEFDKSTILQQSYFELMRLISLLNTYPNMSIEIGGHTDARGSEAYNQRLSESRAKAVTEYLILKGVSEKRLHYKGYGKAKPIDTNDTEEGRARNRRVEFKVLSI